MSMYKPGPCAVCKSEEKTFTGCCLYAAAKDFKGEAFSSLSDSDLDVLYIRAWDCNDPDRHIITHQRASRAHAAKFSRDELTNNPTQEQ